MIPRPGPSNATSGFLGIILLTSMLALLPKPSAAQLENKSPPDPKSPSFEEVQQLLDKATNDKDLDEANKSELTKAYGQILENLKASQQWTQLATQFESSKKSAPERLQTFRNDLAKADEPLPEPPKNATLADIEGILTTTKASAEAASKEVDQLALEATTRSERRRSIPQQLVQLRQSLANAQQELSEMPPSETSESPLVAANRMRLGTLAETITQQIRALEAEVQSYEARGELLSARQELASRTLARLKKIEEIYQNSTNRLREISTRKAEKEAREALRDVKAIPLLSALAERNTTLAEERTEVSKSLKDLADELRKAEGQSQKIDSAFKDAKNRIGVAGLTGPLGLLLRQQRDALPSTRSLRREIDNIADRLAATELSRIELEIEKASSIEEEWREEVNQLADGTAGWSREEIATKAQELAAVRRDLFRSLLEDYGRAFNLLVDLDVSRRLLLDLIREYRSFVDERILWIRSSSPLWREDSQGLLDGVQLLISPKNWSECVVILGNDVRRSPAIAGGLGILLFGLFALGPFFKRKLRITGEAASRGSCTSIKPTVLAVLLTAALSLAKALTLWAIGWRLGAGADTTDFARGLSTGLRAGALYLLAFESVLHLVRPKGVGESHFRWNQESTRLMRRGLRLLGIPGLLLIVVISSIHSQGHTSAQDGIARISFLIGMILLLIFLYPILHPSKGLLSPRAQQIGWVQPTRRLWFAFGIIGPVGLFVLALLGYYFTANKLFDRMSATAWLIFAAVILNALILRVLLLARRKLLLKQVQERMAIRDAKSESEKPEDSLQSLDVATVDQQSRQLVRSLIALGLAIGMWITWAEVLPALAFLDQVEIWNTKVTEEGVAKTIPVTLANLIIAGVVVILTVIAARNIPGLLEISILQRLEATPGERYAIKALSQYAIVLIGIVYGFSKIGISWSSIQWLAAALTVGLGFGLQEIFANFFSGLILLFERPIRVGDIVTIGTVDGKVSRIQMRATTITDWNNRELVVPNKEFVTGSLVNWTLTDPVTRVVIPVGVAYGSDIKLVRSTLLRIGEAHPLTMNDPAPSALFRAFGDSALSFDLRVFIANRDLWPELINSIHEEIDMEFRRLGIEIAFPQRDIHIRSANGLLQLEPKPTDETTATASTSPAPSRDQKPTAKAP